jgi:hypothetical protein
MIGNPPYCKPECIGNTECSSHLACINQKCKDPCPNACGLNAECKVISHTPMCYCLNGYTGDPFGQCSIVRQDYPVEVHTPCSPSPCGSNAICREQNGAGACTCISDYFGNPYEGCRPECVLNSDCTSSLACISNKCKDPCPGTCGLNAVCQVVNHLPSCSCISGYSGDPYRQCNFKQNERKILSMANSFHTTNNSFHSLHIHLSQNPKPHNYHNHFSHQSALIPEYVNPCQPSPCGPNSQCKEVNNQAVCSCLPSYIGSPPGCRPECVVSSECSYDKACSNQKCVDPCPNTCGQNAKCRVNNHSPICYCMDGYTGDPFTRCYPQPRKIIFFPSRLKIDMSNFD